MTTPNIQMQSKSIEEKIKNAKLGELRMKLGIVGNIMQKSDSDTVTAMDQQSQEGDENETLTRVQLLCQIDTYLVYQAMKLVGIQNREMPLNRWLNEVTLQEKHPYEEHAKLSRLREPLVKTYLKKRTIPSEDSFKKHILPKTDSQWIPVMSCLKINGYILQRLPKTKKSIIIEKPKQLTERISYLKKIAQYREEGRTIVYLEERIRSKRAISLDIYNFEDACACAHCLIFCNGEGIITNSDMLYRDYHSTALEFLLNFINKNLAYLPPNSVVVLEDKGHHKKDAPPLPTKYSLRKQMIDWLSYNDIKHNQDLHRAELYKLIALYKRDFKVTDYVDKTLKLQGHDVVRRPYHCQYLNHFNDYWTQFNQIVQKKQKQLQISHAIKDSMREATEIFTPNVLKQKESDMIETERTMLREDLQIEEIIDRLCTLTKYGDVGDKNHSDLRDLNYPLLEPDYIFSKNVATSLDETESYPII